MAAKSEFLQIRVTSAQKAELRRMAAAAHQDLSTFVLHRILAAPGARFRELVAALGDEDERPFAFSELNDVLATLSPESFRDSVPSPDLRSLDRQTANYVAAMVEQAAALAGQAPPEWTREVEPLEEPWFATSLASLRPWLLANSPTAFRRRNLFVDAAVGDRV